MKDYSQNGEGRIIQEHFGTFTGYFLSLGENDGECLSNVRHLAVQNWLGVCVEPSPAAFAKLKALYAGNEIVRCVQAAITTQDGPIDFYDSGTHLKKGDTSLLSTTRPEELARWKKSGEVFTKTTVRGITVASLLKELGLKLPPTDMSSPVEPDDAHFDFISIDCEGADLDVLRQIDLTAVGCRMLCVEVNQRGDAEFTEYAAKHGMKLHWKSYENRIFVRA